MIIIPRIARKNLNTPFLHMMVQGVNKKYIFYKKEYIENYLKLINKNYEKNNLTVMAYCIMSNHAHFLIYTENINELGRIMHKVNLQYAQMYNKKEKRCGVLFRNRYRIEPIYDKKYLINCIKYIHNNPVKANMVSKCEEYEYSSYKEYVKNGEITKSEIMKKIFGLNCDFFELFKKSIDIKFADYEDELFVEKKEYIKSGIIEFKKIYNKKIFEILSERDTLKKLIYYLKIELGIKYVDIRDFFEISRGTMDALKIM